MWIIQKIVILFFIIYLFIKNTKIYYELRKKLNIILSIKEKKQVLKIFFNLILIQKGYRSVIIECQRQRIATTLWKKTNF